MSNLKKEFGKIYQQYIDNIYRFVFLKVNSQEIAEDLASETFLHCWEKYKDEKKTIENPRAFLYQIARNLVTDYYRENGRTKTISADCVPIIDSDCDLEKESQNKSDMEVIRAVLPKINEDYQDVIIWHYLDEFSISEISKMTEKTEGNVRVWLCRALKALKNELPGEKRESA